MGREGGSKRGSLGVRPSVCPSFVFMLDWTAHRVAGEADDEEVAEALVEDHLLLVWVHGWACMYVSVSYINQQRAGAPASTPPHTTV